LEAWKQVFYKTHRGVGFYGGVRLLFPIVETLGKIYHPGSEHSGPYFFTNELHYPVSFLLWEMYRNGLMHGDEPGTVEYNEQIVSWSISIGGVCSVGGHRIQLDIARLYSDLDLFLAERIQEDTQANVIIESGTILSTASQEIQDEFHAASGEIVNF